MIAKAVQAFAEARYGEELALLWLLCLWQWEQRASIPGEVGMAYRSAFLRLTPTEQKVAHSQLQWYGVIDKKGGKS